MERFEEIITDRVEVIDRVNGPFGRREFEVRTRSNILNFLVNSQMPIFIL